jgi:predicted nuclease of predicted toxin-antitoxin system
MNVLLDSCVWRGARDALEAAGHAVCAVSELWEKDPGDLEVLRNAHAQERVLITLDKDFGELAIVRGMRHSGLVRLVGIRAREQGAAAAQALRVHGEELAGGAIVTVEPDRIRVRPGQL